MRSATGTTARRRDRHRAGDRLPARARPGHPAGDRDLDRGVGAGRHPGEGPPRPRADAHGRRGAVRQDRHPHPGQPRGHRRGRRRRPLDDDEVAARSPPRSRPTASTRSPGPSSPRPPGLPVPPAPTFTRAHRPRRRGRRSTARRTPSAGRPCSASAASRVPDDARRPRPSEWAGRGAAVLYLVDDGDGRSRRSRSRTRSGPRPPPPWPTSTSSGVGHVVMITGDARSVAEAVGRAVGVDEVFAEVLPADKDRTRRRAPGARAGAWRWSATASTTPRRWPGPTSASPSAPAPTWPSSRPASCSPAATRGPWPASSGCRGPLPQDAPEPGVGRRLQRRRHPAGRRRVRLGRHHPAPGRRRDPDERCRPSWSRSTPSCSAASSSAAREVDRTAPRRPAKPPPH